MIDNIVTGMILGAALMTLITTKTILTKVEAIEAKIQRIDEKR